MAMTFEKQCKVFLMEEPFYGIILSSMNKMADERVGTLGVGPDGDSFRLVYNPKFLERFSDNTVLELLKHEMEHICFNHPFMGQHTGYDKENMSLFNDACDYECNSYLNRSRMDEDVNGLWPEDKGFPRNLGARKYYELLKNQPVPPQQRQPIQPPPQENGGQGGQQGEPQENNQQQNEQQSQQSQSQSTQQQQESNNPGSDSGNGSKPDNIQQDGRSMDNHSIWPTKMPKEQAVRIVKNVENLMVEAAENVEKSCGKEHIPDALRIRIDQLRKKAKPVADWRRYCRRFMGNEYTYLTKKSRRRESRRFEGMAGTRHQRTSKILVAIDTSGSVCMKEYKEFMQQVLTMKDIVTFDVVECDTKIRHEYRFTNRPNMQLHGGGGTDFEEPIELFRQRGDYDALIYFTDGECNIPYDTPKETLWIVSSQGRRENDYTRNGAKVVFIPKEEE